MNSLLLKLDNGNTVTHYVCDQNYGDRAAQAALANAVVQAHLPDRTVVSYALVEVSLLEARIATEAKLDTDFLVAQKQDVPGDGVILPPDGVILSDIPATDYCVYYKPAV